MLYVPSGHCNWFVKLGSRLHLLKYTQWLDSSSPDHPSRRAILDMMLKLVSVSKRIPATYTVSEVIFDSRTLPLELSPLCNIYRGSFCGRAVAVKRLRVRLDENVHKARVFLRAMTQYLINGPCVQSLLRETVMWKNIRHEHLVPFIGIYAADQNPQSFVVVSPWMDNGTLRDYISAPAYDPALHREKLASR
jgi:serine/threonine protein kinase